MKSEDRCKYRIDPKGLFAPRPGDRPGHLPECDAAVEARGSLLTQRKEADISTREVSSNDASGIANVDMKLEVVVIPVSDVDRAKEFYGRLGWRLDVTPPGVVQITPHGSWCSIQFCCAASSAEG